MKVLILTSAKRPPDAYLEKLKEWMIEAEVRPLPVKLEFEKRKGRDDIYPHSLQKVADWVYERYAESVDVIQLFINTRDWDYGGSLKGIAYHRIYNGYQISAFKERKYWDRTARHELAHDFDDIVRVYTGYSLEKIVNVRDWDDDVVHRRDPKTRKYSYDYDKEFWAVKPYLEEAVRARRNMHRASIIAKLGVAWRGAIVGLKEPEVIVDEEAPAEPNPAPEPITVPNPAPMPKRDLLYEFCKGIEKFEDYVVPGGRYRDGKVAPQGSLSYRNRNPGNLRYSPFQAGTRNNFAYFTSYAKGWEGLMHQVRIAAQGKSKVYKPTDTIYQFFEKYAPATDNNFPKIYAEFVASHVGLPPTTRMSALLS